LENGAVLRVDVDYARIAKSKLRRQRACNERNVVREAGLQYLAKTRNTFREKDVVDAVLQICMFAADMKLAE
jgi:ATP-dependent 26S proteasome regulatory subunit